MRRRALIPVVAVLVTGLAVLVAGSERAASIPFKTEVVRWSPLDAAGNIKQSLKVEGLSRNIPPLNTIFAGRTDEILQSEVGADEFDAWWARGEDIATFTPAV